MKNLNACLASLNLGLPDDVRRLKEAGYYTEAIACIDTYLAEDWTKTQNQPVQPAGPLPENPTPHGVDAMRDALLAQREILRRLPLDYTVPEAQALELLQSLVRGFTPEEFRALDRAGAMDWRFVEGEKRYIRSFAETLLATHPELAARQIDPPQQHPSWERYEPEHEQMVRTGAVSADITLETCIGMSDEAFAAALAAAKQQGRSTVHIRRPARHRAASRWIPSPSRRPTLHRKMLPSARRIGRPTLPRTGPLARCTVTVPRSAMPTRCTCRRTPCSRILTRRRSCRIWSSRPICGHWRPSSPRGSPTRCRRQSASTTM